MLGNLDEREKQRNQIVFRLLKSMDPYLPSLNQHQEIRKQIINILKQNAYNIIHEQNIQDGQDEESLNQSIKNIQNKKLARSLASKVFDVTVAHGGWWDAQIERKKKQLQMALAEQLQSQRQSKMIRKQIQTIHNDVRRNFIINKKLPINSGSISTYQAHQNNLNSNYSELNNNSSSIINNFQRFHKGAPNNLQFISNIPSSMSIYAEGQPSYGNLSSVNQPYKGFQKDYNNQRNRNFSYNNFQNQSINGRSQIKDNKIVSFNNQKFYDEENERLSKITSNFSLLRSQLSCYHSPIKKYRHQTDKILNVNRTNDINSKQMIKIQKIKRNQQNQLGLQSRIKDKGNNSKIIKSKSQIKLKKDQRQSNHNSKVRSMSSRSIKLQKFLEKNPKIRLDINNLNKKVSEKTLKQSQKLDMQIMASILHKKIRDSDKSNTIASLIK